MKTNYKLRMPMVLVAVLSIGLSISFADDLDEGPGGLGPQPSQDSVPIDGGISFLAAAAGVYGYKKLKGKSMRLNMRRK